MGPALASTVLTVEEEAMAVVFRRHTLLPLDDCLYALQATIPSLFVCAQWQKNPAIFTRDPTHLTMELYT